MYNVILVDNEPWVLNYLVQQFPWKEYEFKVIAQCVNSIEATNIILDQQPDAVFTDINMPEVTGLQLMEKIFSAGLDCEFVLISGYADFSYAQQAIRLGAFDYCLKPIDNETAQTLLTRLKQQLDVKKKQSVTDWENYQLQNTSSIEALIHFVDQHYCEKLRLKELAAKFYINPNYCSTLFTKKTGYNFPEYLNGLRIRKACKMLRMTSLSIQQIAAEVGIEDNFYFSKVFKKLTGMNPSEYRKKAFEHD